MRAGQRPQDRVAFIGWPVDTQDVPEDAPARWGSDLCSRPQIAGSRRRKQFRAMWASGPSKVLLTRFCISRRRYREELRIIWELEPGRQILDHAYLSLPDPDGTPSNPISSGADYLGYE